jgi:mannose-6-phosphate isomerase-like protein (cupin superfamily)
MNEYTTTKPWGYEIRFAQNDKYLGKILYIAQGHRLSRQYHQLKDETIMVYEGTLILELGIPGILPGVVHRFCAPERKSVTLIEVSTPEIDDVTRLEDDYKRV